jgi:hypothetical protein
VEHAYALIAFGKMEQKHLQQLKWNPRIEVILNSLITNSTTSQEMCSQTYAVYQKVLDSNTLEQMDEHSLNMLATIIKAGTLGDARWCQKSEYWNQRIDWRRLLIYAEHQNIRNYVDYGITILGLSAHSLDTERLPAYFPESYQRPQSIKKLIGNYKGDETDYLLRMIRQIEKQPLMLHLIELTRELYRESVNDDRLKVALEEKGLTKYASRLMQVLSEQTLLEEGFMPIASVRSPIFRPNVCTIFHGLYFGILDGKRDIPVLLEALFHVSNELAICSNNFIIALHFLSGNVHVVLLFLRPPATSQLVAPVFHDNEEAVAGLLVRKIPFD